MIATLRILLEGSNAHPFLFLGSGFSRRYLGSDDWKGLVTRFARQALPDNEFAFEWYKNETRNLGALPVDELPVITALVEKDYNSRFLTSSEFQPLRQTYAELVNRGVSPLRSA